MLQHPLVRKGIVSFDSNDQVVQQRNFQNPAGFLHFLSDVPVGLAGCKRAGRMVVRDDNARGIGLQCGRKDQPHVNNGAGGTSSGQLILPEHPVAAAQEQYLELLYEFDLVGIPTCQEDIESRCRRAYLRALRRPDCCPVDQLNF